MEREVGQVQDLQCCGVEGLVEEERRRDKEEPQKTEDNEKKVISRREGHLCHAAQSSR